MTSPWMKFYPSDWQSDPMLRCCSIAARGLWVEMMCLMHKAEPYGSLLVNGARIDKRKLAVLVGISEKECSALLMELEGNGVFSRDDDGTLYSRRMRRDFAKAVKDKSNGLDGGNPAIRRGSVPKDQRVRPYRRSDAPEKTLRIFNKTGGKCHWCEVPLLFHPDGSPNGFHVDHVLPICDGGTNDENNLVAACAACNHKRARLSDPTASQVNVGINSDVKAQKLEARSQIPEPERKKTRASALAVPWDESHWEMFWDRYPHRVGKADARKAFERMTGKAAPDEIFPALQRYADKTDDRPFCNPSTWLNQERWLDQPADTNGKRNQHTSSERRVAGSDFFAGINSLAQDFAGDCEHSGTRPDEIPRGRVEIDG